MSAEEEKKEEAKVVPEKVQEALKLVNGMSSEEKSALGLEVVKSLSVMELSAWVKSMEEEFGVSAQPVMAAGAFAGGQGGAPAAEAEVKDSFDVVLTAIGEKKIQVIKEVRSVTSLGLKEAKTLVEEAPKAVKEGLPEKEAQEIKAKLEAVGATVELK